MKRDEDSMMIQQRNVQELGINVEKVCGNECRFKYCDQQKIYSFQSAKRIPSPKGS